MDELIEVKRFNYTGSPQTVDLTPGVWKLECIGASGGDDASSIGGLGGYAKGNLHLFSPLQLHIYVGGAGQSGVTGRGGGWNGGGNAGRSGTSGGGGGATDIRLNDSLYSRIIVAGGGGGAGLTTVNNNGGNAGGLEGQKAGSVAAATQTSGASFGIGSHCESSDGGGGGGGWYGGRGSSMDSGAGGGSSYVWTEQSKINYPSECQVPDTLFLDETELIGGYNQRLANGYVIITFVGKVEIRKNSNAYKNIYEQSVFDFLQLSGE